MSTTDITFDIEVKGAQAKAELAAIGKSAETMGGSLDRVTNSLKGTAGKIDSSFGTIERMMKQAGVSAGGAGKAMTEVVGSAADVAQAFAMGGPLMGALTAGTAVIGELTRAWEAELKAQDAVIEKQFKAQMALIDQTKAIEKEHETLRRRSIGTEAALMEDLESTQRRIAELEDKRALASQLHDKDTFRQLSKQIELLKEIQNFNANGPPSAPKNIARPDRLGPGESIEPASDQEWTPFAVWAKGNKTPEELPTVAFAGSATSGPMGKARRDVEAFYDEATQAAMLSTERQKALWQDVAFVVSSTAAAMSTEMADLGKGAFSSLIGSAQTYFVALASGEKHAAEMAAASFLQSTGDKLVGFGTEATFKGAGYLIDSAGLDPRGYAMLGLGAAAISAGIGMGAAGAAVSAGIPKDAAKTSGPTHTGGGFRGRGGGSNDGRGITNIINYGIAGPQPDETAREIGRQLRRSEQRGFVDSSFSRSRG